MTERGRGVLKLGAFRGIQIVHIVCRSQDKFSASGHL